MLQLSSLSTEFVRVQVAATSSGVAVDPTNDAAFIAFPLEGVSPVSGDWKSASWEIDSSQTPVTNYVRALVGSGGVALSAGTYDCWVKVSDNPEVPVKKAGSLRVI